MIAKHVADLPSGGFVNEADAEAWLRTEIELGLSQHLGGKIEPLQYNKAGQRKITRMVKAIMRRTP